MITIEIHDRLPIGSDAPSRQAEIPDRVPLETFVLTAVDNGDPQNQHALPGFTIPGKIAVMCRFSNVPNRSEAVRLGMRALLIYAIEHAAELRDMLR